MKKLFAILFLISFLAGLIAPTIIFAADVASPLCEAALVAADVGKSCGTAVVPAAGVGKYCCSTENFILTNQQDCRDLCAAAAGPAGGPISSCTLKYDLQDIDPLCTKNAKVGPTPDAWGLCCIVNTIYRVSDIVFNLLIASVVILVLVGAYYFLTAGGSPGDVQKGRNYILYAMVGLVVAFLAKAIASLSKMLF